MNWLQEIMIASTVEEIEKIVGDHEDRGFIIGYVLRHMDEGSVVLLWAKKNKDEIQSPFDKDESS